MIPFFINDEVFVVEKTGGEWLEDFCKLLYESSVEADVPEKALWVSQGSQESEEMRPRGH